MAEFFSETIAVEVDLRSRVVGEIPLAEATAGPSPEALLSRLSS